MSGTSDRPRRRPILRWLVVGVAATILVVLAGGLIALLTGRHPWDSTNTYPIDFFSEMHYQKSYRSLEPPRLVGPEGIVPIEGRAPMYSREEMAGLENPLPLTEETTARGEQVYRVNCQVCHGPEGRGDGPMAGYFAAVNAPPPADYTAQPIVEMSDGELYAIIVYGQRAFMPPFGKLIPEEDRWAVVQYIRSLQSR